MLPIRGPPTEWSPGLFLENCDTIFAPVECIPAVDQQVCVLIFPFVGVKMPIPTLDCRMYLVHKFRLQDVPIALISQKLLKF